MAERAFASKLDRVGFVDVTTAERRPWGIEDCARYPLFDEDLLGLMRRLVPPEDHASVASAVTFTANKPLHPDARGSDLVASHAIRNQDSCGVVLPDSAEQPRRAELSQHDSTYDYDAGDLGCGDGLPREVRRHIGEIPVGARIKVTVRDPAAKADLPPLVRMLGHRLLSEEAHPDGRLVFEVERTT